ncbi:PREDICTED: uncharacterized protein CXorf66 homolog [Condylura cristata]|uniref:uncharacterized protein CXorf66 homolog n=1 Tax=Condylura cristata TaxID=143302 RepID=UPI0003345AFF|nr:PREDICTED: uncharacterized protein CXorf66 homolog [Condylura cristata]
MKLHIYVLFLSIWTISCLNTNQTEAPTTTAVTRHTESMKMKMDSFRRHLLIIVIGIMVIAFAFTCFCFFHYNCANEGETGKKEVGTGNPSISTKILVPESKALSPITPEKPLMLLGTDKLCIDKLGMDKLGADKLPGPSMAEKSNRPSSPEKSAIPSSEEKLIKHSSSEKSIQSSGEMLIKPSSKDKSFKSPKSKKLYGASHLDNKHKKTHVGKSHKTPQTNKPVSPCYPNKVTRPLSSIKPTNPLCPPSPQNQTPALKSSSFQKLSKHPRNSNLKWPGNNSKTDTLSVVESCRCYKKSCLICHTLYTPLINDIAEAEKKESQNLSFSNKLKSFSRSYYKVDSSDNALMSDSDTRTYDSNDDSEREITIICNIKHKEITFKGTQNRNQQ